MLFSNYPAFQAATATIILFIALLIHQSNRPYIKYNRFWKNLAKKKSSFKKSWEFRMFQASNPNNLETIEKICTLGILLCGLVFQTASNETSGFTKGSDIYIYIYSLVS